MFTHDMLVTMSDTTLADMCTWYKDYQEASLVLSNEVADRKGAVTVQRWVQEHRTAQDHLGV